LEKKVVVAATVAVVVVRASAWGGTHLLVGEEGGGGGGGSGTHVLGVGSGLSQGRARVRVTARRSIPFLAPGFRRLKMTRSTMNTFTLISSAAPGFRHLKTARATTSTFSNNWRGIWWWWWWWWRRRRRRRRRRWWLVHTRNWWPRGSQPKKTWGVGSSIAHSRRAVIGHLGSLLPRCFNASE